MLTLPLARVHNDLCSGKFNIDKVLTALCEVLSYYHCDLLLLTGRPSQLPGIQAIIRRNLPLPPGRILPLHGYQTGTRYPFHKMVYRRSEEHRLRWRDAHTAVRKSQHS